MSSLRTQGTVGQLKRWLSKPHKETVEAVLMTRENVPMTLGRFERDRITPELAEEICTLVDEHAVTRPGIEASFMLRADDGRILGEKIIQPVASLSTVDDEALAGRFATGGDPMSQAQNAQRHLEGMSRLYFQQHALMMQVMRDVIKDQNAQLMEHRKEAASARAERDALSRELAQSMEAAAPTAPDGDADAQVAEMQVQVIKMLQPLAQAAAPILVQKLLSPPPAPPPKPST